MKILVLSSHTPSLFWFRLDMMLSFVKCGCEVVAVGNEPEQEWEIQFANNGIKYRSIYIQRNGINPLKDLKTLKGIKCIIKEERPDKIFAYNAKTIIYGGLAAHKYKIETYSLIAGLGSVFMGESLKNKMIKLILSSEYRKSLKYSKNVFFQNNDDVKAFLDKKIVRPEQIVMLHGSGVNLEKFSVQKMPNSFGFLFIGRLIRDKGVLEYLEACKILKEKYPNVRCLLVGPFDSNPSALKESELKPYLEKHVIEYFGEQKDVRTYLAQCNVFVLPSYREGTPKAVLEAMACGKAVITTDAPGCKETVVDGKNGFLVKVKNVENLVEKMIALYNNIELVNKMAICGRRMAEDIFDVNKVNDVIVSTMRIKES